MTLPELCEPVFLALCRLSRRHQAGDAPSSRQVREELAGILADLRARAALSAALLSQFDRTEPAIILCIDQAVRASGWPCARTWLPGPGLGAGAADDAGRFFALLRQNLDDPSPAADERLEVLAYCAAVAFSAGSLGEAHRAQIDQLRVRLGIESPTALWSRPRPITDDLSRRAPRPAIAAIALGLALLAVITALSSGRSAARVAAARAERSADTASAEPTP